MSGLNIAAVKRRMSRLRMSMAFWWSLAAPGSGFSRLAMTRNRPAPST